MAEAAVGSEERQGKFLTGSLMRHVTVMALSGTLGLMFTFLVDFLALWWIGRLGVEDLIAAVGIAGTIQFAAISAGIGMMIGTVALVSRHIGMGRRETARRIGTVGVIATVTMMAALSLVLIAFLGPILHVSGARGEVAEVAHRFLVISMPSLPLFAVGIITSAILRAVGDAWRSTAVVMIGGALALVIDPLLIIWMNLGVPGAAMSIVLARLAMAGLGLWYVLRVHRMLARPRRHDFSDFTRPYLGIALPAILTQISTPFGTWILTREMALQGDAAAAGWGVVMRLTILAFGGIFALSGAIGGIIGQNYGAGRADRVAEAFRAALIFCLVYTGVVWALLAALTGVIATSFRLSPGGEAVVRTFTFFAAGSFVFTGALFVANAAFNNLGRPLWSTRANWFRDGILMFPLSWAAAGVAGAVGIVLAQALANVIAGALAAWLAWTYIADLKARGENPGRAT
jgi:putative MATE family efflux protein